MILSELLWQINSTTGSSLWTYFFILFQLHFTTREYYIVKNIYGYPYEFEFTGMTKGKVPPENIISIEEIKGYIQMQEKYPDYVEFYNEIE